MLRFEIGFFDILRLNGSYFKIDYQ